MVGHVTEPAAAPLVELPGWVTLVRAPNPGPMTLDGTNTWILRPAGSDRCIVIDPGPLDDAHLVAVAGQGDVSTIIMTHGHSDHIDGLDRLRQLCPGAEVIHPGTRIGPVPVSGTVSGTVPVSGTAGFTAADGFEIEIMPTPGHTADSVTISVATAEGRIVLTGDTILGRGTTVVAHPDGDLGDYLESLERLAELGPVPVLPGHGPALADCSAAARFYLIHRRARLEQVRQAVAAGARRPADVVAQIYADVDPSLRPAATLSVLAQLAYLERERER